MLSSVKSKHDKLEREDSKTRLTRLGVLTANNQRGTARIRNTSRISSSSQTNRNSCLKKKHEEKENHLVTNYLQKIENSESRILGKELQQEKRVIDSKKNKVKCFVEERNRKENEKMETVDKEHQQRMQHFDGSRQRVHMMRKSVQLQRSAVNLKKYMTAAQRRRDSHEQELVKK